jgi:hypothetical protein
MLEANTGAIDKHLRADDAVAERMGRVDQLGARQVIDERAIRLVAAQTSVLCSDPSRAPQSRGKAAIAVMEFVSRDVVKRARRWNRATLRLV